MTTEPAATSTSSPLFPGKQFIGTVLEALETKHAMSAGLISRYLQRASVAGFIIGLMYVASYTVTAAFAGLGTGATGVGRIAGAITFGWALVFIHYSKSELLTSNMMIVSIGAYYHRTSWLRAGRLLLLCFVGNAIGGLVMALLLKGSTLLEGPVRPQLDHALEVKQGYVAGGLSGMLDLGVRAVLCNFLINLAMLLVYNGIIKDDFTKSTVMVVAVTVFAFLGFEHSVANTVFFTIMAFQGGVVAGQAIGNVAICLVGNFIGGGLLIGFYYAYVNDEAGWRRRHG